MRLNRYKKSTTSSSAFLTYVKKYWWILPLGYLCIWAYYQYKKLINTQETKTDIVEVKNVVIKNSAVNSNSSTSDLVSKFQQVKNRFKGSKGLTPKLWDSMRSDSENIAIALGTHAKNNRALFGLDSWFGDRPDPNSFFEDEKEALRILKKYPNTFPILSELYYKLFTRSRNLKSDIIEYISKSDIDKLRTHYKKYGKTWL